MLLEEHMMYRQEIRKAEGCLCVLAQRDATMKDGNQSASPPRQDLQPDFPFTCKPGALL